ncbi:MAG: hypothetical protein ABSG73_08005 [Candidatus Aminicenantales bacterium]|jgi:hypothetical protein
MKAKWLTILFLAALTLGIVSCYRPYGYSFYPGVPRFTPTNPGAVELMRHDPRGDHIRLGEVWIRPDPGMSRGYVEGILREKAALMGADALVIVADRYFREGVVYNYWRGRMAVYERQIVGVAIRFRR